MNIKEIKSIGDLIKDVSKKELLFYSLFLLLILLGAWLILLNRITFLDGHDTWKFLILCVIAGIYIVAIFYMKCSDTQEDKLKRARLHIETRLKKIPGHRASYDRIREDVNSGYDDEFMEKLIELNPEIFGKCEIRLTDGSHKKGITLVTGRASTAARKKR